MSSRSSYAASLEDFRFLAAEIVGKMKHIFVNHPRRGTPLGPVINYRWGGGGGGGGLLDLHGSRLKKS